MSDHTAEYMRLALTEAEKGLGRTSPNPSVGAVIVNDRVIVGKGYHKRAGTPHAEVNAIGDACGHTHGATIYVTLEPCNHTGSTPPCTRAILEAGIRKVVVGTVDPNPTVAGGGIEFLRTQGVEVEVGVLEKECRKIIRPFVKHVTTGIPWVVLKAGMSLDGKISYQKGRGGRITGIKSRERLHQMRDRHDAIMIGVNTALVDDPSLTTRLSGKEGRDPLRIVLDTNLRLSPDSKLLTQPSDAATWIFCSHRFDGEKKRRLEKKGAMIRHCETDGQGHLDLRQVFETLGRSNVLSVLVEGGAAIHGSLLRDRLADEACLFVAPFFIGSQGVQLLERFHAAAMEETVSLHQPETIQLGDDWFINGVLSYPATEAKVGHSLNGLSDQLQ